ncbi:OmpH family outer membrane protein [Sporocytophaga myxococcoides]|uniref:OmpH family outer membrane protein n=1 Tax=Sporocytophaga myxococcoides TaxID=153721 RepID=UPI000423E679|nr:OmpH family outer membrane protein [Sporocytophaga myxococcoides]
MNKRSYIIIFSLVIFLSGIISYGVSKFTSPKIGYVRSGELVKNFEGMKEAKNIYKSKMEKWQANIDTLQGDYRSAVSKYTNDLPGLSKKEKEERELYLGKQEQGIRDYVKSLEEKAKEEDEKMTQAVLNQINSYIKEYGENHGYDVILGLTQEGNVLYGNDSKDITEDLLKGINDWYKNKEEQK